ncbi:MAG: hypothetical protein KJO76_10965, partial [Gammaproteobacteria bacterium]|nr:hypothetical protein [Gammaproteobacteria bacterium]
FQLKRTQLVIGIVCGIDEGAESTITPGKDKSGGAPTAINNLYTRMQIFIVTIDRRAWTRAREAA